MKAEAMIQGKLFKVDEDFNLITEDQVIPKHDMQGIAKEYKDINRVHKPMVLLFWTDIKNGKTKNWKLWTTKTT